MDTSSSDASAVGAWYVRYAARLRRVTHRIVGNAYDAEDATHDAFVAALRAQSRYRPDADPYPWLFRIATRKALDIAAERLPFVREASQPAELVPSAEDEAVARDEARHVATLVAAEMPVALHLIDGLRFRDVSERLGIPAATAATRIRRGKRRLRAILGEIHPQATPAHVQRSKTA